MKLTKAMLVKTKRIREIAEANSDEDDDAKDFLCDIFTLAVALTHDIEKLNRGLVYLNSAVNATPSPVCGAEGDCHDEAVCAFD